LRETIKYIALIVIGFVVILYTGIPMIKMLFRPEIVIRKRIDINKFYNEQMTDFIFNGNNGEQKILPDKKNHLIFGINKNPYSELQVVYFYLDKLTKEKYDIDIIAVNGIEKVKTKGKLSVLRYNTKEMGEFFGLTDNDDFTLIVDSTNAIKYFDYRLIDGIEFELLINKFKRED
jgi:hypothetical protein